MRHYILGSGLIGESLASYALGSSIDAIYTAFYYDDDEMAILVSEHCGARFGS